MSSITVPLPEEDLTFLRAYTAAHGISPETFFAQQAHNLRMNLQRPLSPEVKEATGIISADVAGEEAYRSYLEEKHA